MKSSWNRRQVLQHGLAFTATLSARTSSAQALPSPEVLQDDRYSLITTTREQSWRQGTIYKPSFAWDMLNLNVSAESMASAARSSQTMHGFGACFNELGWTALKKLPPADRDAVMQELFGPTHGARFTYCRMPLGANDFSTAPYSYDEVANDFALRHFSIEHDHSTLVPFIHSAQACNPALKLWASPWTPPSWMKRNHFYAEAQAMPGWIPNGIRPDQIGHEGQDLFLLEPRYLAAYANYFAKFIQAYAAEGIRIGMVMPQNEFNSPQNFPSCTWTPEGLIQFVRILGPKMTELGVDIFFGTLERGNPALFETVRADPTAGPFLKGIGVQWAGKNALPALHQHFPVLPIYGSEQECGDGGNTWEYTGYCWNLMKTYFRNGVRAYMYWNIALEQGGKSTWGWSQNSLVLVNSKEGSFRYTSDYYLLKHLTHFVEVGATPVTFTGTCNNCLSFRNPDGSLVVLLRNELSHTQAVQLQIAAQSFHVQLAPDSISTVLVRA